MTARVFISYRTADGVDKATALARDLEELFGDKQVFLDKDDLAAGSRWRDEIARTLNQRPILLVLVTPQYLGATDAAGARRIDRTDDPARTELAAAFAADAHVIPLMCDGVERVPDASTLPPPFDQLTELTWRRLRAYDWRDDLARLAGDLQQLGMARQGGAAPPAALPGGTGTGPGTETGTSASTGTGDGGGSARRRIVLLITGALIVLAAVAAGLGWWAMQPPPQPQPQPDAASLTGRWAARIGARGASAATNGRQVIFEVAHEGSRLRLASEPVDIGDDPDWQNYRDFWRQRTGHVLDRVRYRGEGELTGDPGEPRRVSLAMRIEAAATGEQVDGGNLSGEVGEASRRIAGRFWINSEQGERAVVLRRLIGR